MSLHRGKADFAPSRAGVRLTQCGPRLHAYGFDHGRRPCGVSRPDGLSAIDYVWKRPTVLVGSAWPGASKGSVMQMVVPFPSAETSVILPPSCCVTRLWTMYSPSPVLPCARLVVKNGSKT